MTTMTTKGIELNLNGALTNRPIAHLVERALADGEGRLAANGALVCRTGDRTGRSPKDKYLEDTSAIHDKVWWGKVNRPLSTDKFDRVLSMATEHLGKADQRYVFDGWAGADIEHRLGVRVVTEQAWHCMFCETLFIRPGSAADASDLPWQHDWTILNAGRRRLTPEEQAEFGVDSPVLVAQSLSASSS